MRRPTVALVLACIALVPVSAAAQRPHQCEGTVAATLADRGVPVGDVASIYYDAIRRIDHRSSVIIGYDAYLRLDTCDRQGYLVVSMNRACGIRQVYTRLPCSVPAVPAF